MKPQNPLGKYNSMWYNIILVVWELCTFGARGSKKVTKRDSLKPSSKTNLKLDVIGKFISFRRWN